VRAQGVDLAFAREQGQLTLPKLWPSCCSMTGPKRSVFRTSSVPWSHMPRAAMHRWSHRGDGGPAVGGR